MKLVIKWSRRDETTGFVGKYLSSDFTVQYHVILTDEEEALVRKYKLEDYPITVADLHGSAVPLHTVGSLRREQGVILADPAKVRQYIAGIKRSCDELPGILDMYRSDGQEEVVEYPRSQSE
jgi:hypothetical protein